MGKKLCISVGLALLLAACGPMAWGHEVYAFSDGQAECWLDLDFGRFSLGDDFFSGDMSVMWQILQSRYAVIDSYWENERMRVVAAVRIEKKDDADPALRAKITHPEVLEGITEDSNFIIAKVHL